MPDILRPEKPISHDEYEARLPSLRHALLTVQEQLKSADFPVLILVAGIDAAGRSETLNLLSEWMDARYLETVAFGPPAEDEAERPLMWRYWRALPPRGRIGIFYGGIYARAVTQYLAKNIKRSRFEKWIQRAVALERLLVDDGALVVKLWIHIEKGPLKDRLDEWESDPDTAWRVGKHQRERLKHYDKIISLAEQVRQETVNLAAPWISIDGADPHYRGLTAGRVVLEAIQSRLAGPPESRKSTGDLRPASTSIEFPLEKLDLNRKLKKKNYREKLEKYQGKLNVLGREIYDRRRSVVLVFEGWDAAGKGGAIRRVVHALDARQYRVYPIGGPTDEELQHHYLWRFWRRLPRAGKFAIFDRSWYGRVLVERVEKLAQPAAWQRAYDEIIEFESQLCDHGYVLAKFWLHIDPDEQLRRFQAREKIPYKNYKITDEDYRNRSRWPQYELAADEMVHRTSTKHAPWTLVAANDKRYARIKVLRTLVKTLEGAL